MHKARTTARGIVSQSMFSCVISSTAMQPRPVRVRVSLEGVRARGVANAEGRGHSGRGSALGCDDIIPNRRKQGCVGSTTEHDPGQGNVDSA